MISRCGGPESSFRRCLIGLSQRFFLSQQQTTTANLHSPRPPRWPFCHQVRARQENGLFEDPPRSIICLFAISTKPSWWGRWEGGKERLPSRERTLDFTP